MRRELVPLALTCVLAPSAIATTALDAVKIKSNSWVNEPWTKNPAWIKDSSSKLVKLSKSSIDRIIAHRDSLHTQSKLNLKNHHIAFEWIVCEYLIKTSKQQHNARPMIEQYLKYADSCGGFFVEEYSYWRFLLLAGKADRSLVDVGLKLTDRRKDDFELHISVAKSWVHLTDEADRKPCLAFIDKMMEKWGRKVRILGLKCDHYYLCYRADKLKGIANDSTKAQAIETFEEYLSKQDDPGLRRVASRRLQFIMGNAVATR